VIEVKNILVDGYNVINSWQELKEINTGSMENSRQKLIEVLLNYGVYNGYKMIIVFDAHLQKGSLEKKEKVNKYLEVVFTKEGETADSFIEKFVDSLGRKAEVLVVTSDSLEQQTTFQRGAARMSSIEFYHEVKTTEKKIEIETSKRIEENRYDLGLRIDSEIAKKLEEIRRSK
jgi:predicted RNA-binding protein with PIN domain